MGQFGPHLHHSGFDTAVLGICRFGSYGSVLMDSLEVVGVIVLLGGGIGQSFLSLKRLPDIFPASGQGVLAQSGASSNGEGLFSDIKGS